MLIAIVFSGLAVMLLVTLMVFYNRLTAARNLTAAAFSDIDVQLGRRAQLVPNLVSVTKGYAQHEAEILEDIAAKRSHSRSPEKLAEEDEQLFRAVRRINVLAEGYPELKADGPFIKLMKELGEVEDDLMSARRFYNGSVRVYNTTLQSFPANFVGSVMGMKPAEFYIVSHDEERQPVSTAL
jgi:LemA protein